MSDRLKPRYAALAEAYTVLPPRMNTARATLLVLAITLQEDPQGLRVQRVDKTPANPLGRGPALGLAQFERGGGVAAVMRNGAPSEEPARALVACRPGVAWERDSIWRALERDDVLAMGLARCLLFNLPASLPSPTDVHKAWGQYLEAWGPGKPHAEKWAANHAEAARFVIDMVP